LAGVSSEKIKFCHVISQLDHRYATEVEDIITSSPEREPYSILKAELVRWLSPMTEQRIRQLLTVEIGDRKPSQFLRYLKSLAPDASEDVLRSAWTSRLPHNVQSFLASQNETNLDAAALCADHISEVGVQLALASVDQTPDNATLIQEVAELSCQVANSGASNLISSAFASSGPGALLFPNFLTVALASSITGTQYSYSSTEEPSRRLGSYPPTSF
jgi:hypothetical protein